MPKLFCAAATTLVAGSLLLVPVGSAFAASTPSSPSPSSHSTRVNEPLTAKIDAYDPTTHVATLSGTADWLKRSFSVTHRKADGTRVSAQSGTELVNSANGSWNVTVKDVFAGDTFRIVNGLNTPVVNLPATGAVAEPAAKVTTTASNGVVSGTFTFARHGLVEVRDASGKVLTGSKLADNWNAPAGTPLTYRFSLPDTGSAAHYVATANYASADHTTVDFDVDGAAVANTEIADVTATSGDRAIVKATGQPGATIVVKDGTKVVGVKRVGPSGTVSIPVPVDDEAVNDLTAVQTLAGQQATTDEVKYVAPPAHAELAYVEDHGSTLHARVYVDSPVDAEQLVYRDAKGARLDGTNGPGSTLLSRVIYPAGVAQTITVSTLIDGVESARIPVDVPAAAQPPKDPEVTVEKVTSETISVRIKATPRLDFVARALDGRWLIADKIGWSSPAGGSYEKGMLLEIPRSDFPGSRLGVAVFVADEPVESNEVVVTIPGL